MATYLQVLDYKFNIRYSRLGDVMWFCMGLAKNVFSKDMDLFFQLKFLVNSLQVRISKEKHFSHGYANVPALQA